MKKSKQESYADFRTQDYDESDPFGLIKTIVLFVLVICLIGLVLDKLL